MWNFEVMGMATCYVASVHEEHVRTCIGMGEHVNSPECS